MGFLFLLALQIQYALYNWTVQNTDCRLTADHSLIVFRVRKQRDYSCHMLIGMVKTMVSSGLQSAFKCTILRIAYDSLAQATGMLLMRKGLQFSWLYTYQFTENSLESMTMLSKNLVSSEALDKLCKLEVFQCLSTVFLNLS